MSEITRQDDRVVVKPGRDIVASMVSELREELRSFLREAPSELIVDLDGVEIIDSVGLGLLIATHNSLEKAGGKLIVSNVSKDLCGLFRTMRLDKHFTVFCL